jgi:hypothetical protein
MKPPRREDENPWASLYRRARAVGLDLRTTSLPQAIDLLLAELASEVDHRRRKALVSLEQARRHGSALLARQKSHKHLTPISFGNSSLSLPRASFCVCHLWEESALWDGKRTLNIFASLCHRWSSAFLSETF